MTDFAIIACVRDNDDATITVAPIDQPHRDIATVYHERAFGGTIRTRVNWSALGSVDTTMTATMIDALQTARNIAVLLEHATAQGDDARVAVLNMLRVTYTRDAAIERATAVVA